MDSPRFVKFEVGSPYCILPNEYAKEEPDVEMKRIRLLSLWFLCVDLHSPSGGKSELRTNSAPICHLDTLRYIEICG